MDIYNQTRSNLPAENNDFPRAFLSLFNPSLSVHFLSHSSLCAASSTFLICLLLKLNEATNYISHHCHFREVFSVLSEYFLSSIQSLIINS